MTHSQWYLLNLVIKKNEGSRYLKNFHLLLIGKPYKHCQARNLWDAQFLKKHLFLFTLFRLHFDHIYKIKGKSQISYLNLKTQ